MTLRALYVDLDGTLLGPGGSLLLGADGRFSLLGVRALEACARADVEVVIMTGRRASTAAEIARLIGQTAYIYENGAALMLDGETYWPTGEWQPGPTSIHDQIAATGVVALLLDRYRGRLEIHEPWHRGREVSHVFRGLVDVEEVDALLAEHGLGSLRIVDNGGAQRCSEALEKLPSLRSYHLLPRTAAKAARVAAHMRARGYARGDSVAVGDSREDLTTAEVVGTFWLVANGLETDDALPAALARHANARLCQAAHGAGVYEAVIETLAIRNDVSGRGPSPAWRPATNTGRRPPAGARETPAPARPGAGTDPRPGPCSS